MSNTAKKLSKKELKDLVGKSDQNAVKEASTGTSADPADDGFELRMIIKRLDAIDKKFDELIDGIQKDFKRLRGGLQQQRLYGGKVKGSGK